jgi:hypothetical protein
MRGQRSKRAGRKPHHGARRLRLCRVVAAIGVSVGVLVAVGPLGPGVSSGAAGRAGTQSARVARTFSLHESGRLHLTSKHGFTLNEQGSGSGTITGTIYVHLTIVSTSRVSAEVNIYPGGSSISGVASASYHRGTTSGSFSGSLSISRGTGSYARAHGSGLSFTGTIQRSNDAITVYVSGRVSD